MEKIPATFGTPIKNKTDEEEETYHARVAVEPANRSLRKRKPINYARDDLSNDELFRRPTMRLWRSLHSLELRRNSLPRNRGPENSLNSHNCLKMKRWRSTMLHFRLLNNPKVPLLWPHMQSKGSCSFCKHICSSKVSIPASEEFLRKKKALFTDQFLFILNNVNLISISPLPTGIQWHQWINSLALDCKV